MRSRRDLTQWADRKTAAGLANWLTLPEQGEELAFSYPLQPPREKEVLTDPDQAAVWAGEWARFPARSGVTVDWVERRWPSAGVQRLPDRVDVMGARALAGLAGRMSGWDDLRAKGERLRAELGEYVTPTLKTVCSRLATTSQDDVERLLKVVIWLSEHPDSGLAVRQLPVEGVDTKWLERRRGLVDPLVAAVSGRTGLGLAKESGRFRVRLLDQAISCPLRDFTASPAELAALDITPRWVIVCENLTCVVGLGPLPGSVAVHGLGLDVVELASVPWIEAAQILYWGDIDSHGFRILAQARKTWPQTESILMDEATLDRFSPLAVTEPAPYKSPIGYLNASERATLTRLSQGDLRLEQERVEWTYAWSAIQRRVLAH
ncbi:MAG: DUF2220 family protein [Propionibacteriaceae bacterium]|nr:DUF2220 family protein [Propionibacteriaceae bacterium]